MTGVQKELSSNLELEVRQLRKHLGNTKIAVGFGISTVEQAAKVAQIADAVIIGSKLVKTLEEDRTETFKELVKNFVKNIKRRIKLIIISGSSNPKLVKVIADKLNGDLDEQGVVIIQAKSKPANKPFDRVAFTH